MARRPVFSINAVTAFKEIGGRLKVRGAVKKPVMARLRVPIEVIPAETAFEDAAYFFRVILVPHDAF